MTLEGMIPNAAGETQPRTVEAADYATAKAKLEHLVSESSALLWIRAA